MKFLLKRKDVCVENLRTNYHNVEINITRHIRSIFKMESYIHLNIIIHFVIINIIDLLFVLTSHFPIQI